MPTILKSEERNGGATGTRSRRCRARWWPALAIALAGFSPLSAAGNALGGDQRLFGQFIQDGAIVQKGWIEFAAGYADFSGAGRDLSLSSVVAFRFGRDVEAGVAAGVLSRQRDAGSELFGSTLMESVDSTGLDDVVLYGKYRVLRSPFDLAVGGAASVPTATAGAGRGPGTPQFELFTGLRKNFRRATLVWSAGVAGRGDSEAPGRAAGRTSTKLGAGMLAPIALMWNLVVELTYESARFEGESQVTQGWIGLDWSPAHFMSARGAIAGGLSDGAPDLAVTLSFVFHY